MTERLTDECRNTVDMLISHQGELGARLYVKHVPLLMAEIERLQKRERELVEGLKPFARAADRVSITVCMEDVLTMHDLERAKALVEKEA